MKWFLRVIDNFTGKLGANKRLSKVNSANDFTLAKETIDKSLAIDDSQANGLLSNFYTIGDSLSDLNGLTSVFSMSLRREINVSPPSVNNSYTNGDNAALLVAKHFNIKNFSAGFDYQTANNHFVKHGKNYAIAGATAAEISTGLSLMLNSFKLKDQAVTLLKQHQIQAKDLVFIEIGGNDLFQIMELPRESRQAKLNEAIANIEATLVLLLNHGLRKIVLANTPDISRLPKYLNTPLAKTAKRLSHEFNDRLYKMFVRVNSHYGHSMKLYNLQNKFYEMLKQFKGNICDAPTIIKRDLRAVIKRCTIEIEFKPGIVSDHLDNYFFFDEAHPTKWAHQQVADDLIKLIESMYK
ncbi:SGNH/GDSL hydrolase family protein [Mesoplasma seiffertii]|uniref:SGNH/GDSL hydrolase family protein n=1 Tax=Mesoplasma seiffertii TaxID=28224 RepID=UPI000478B4B0|nr:SGNH/GDSL hydrolase family protein [Mesoplasma seiffertii]